VNLYIRFGSNSKKEKYSEKEKGNQKYFQGAARILDNNIYIFEKPHKMKIILQKRN